MPESLFASPVHPLAGMGLSAPELDVTVRTHVALCQVLARRGRERDLAAALGIDSGPGQASHFADGTVLPLAPGRWLLLGEAGRDGSFTRAIAARIAGTGHASEQSHGYSVIRIGGGHARRVLAKGCRLDLHPRVAVVDWCAQTPIAGIGTILYQVDGRPAYDLIVFAGFAQAFWHWLQEACAEFT